MIVRLRNFRQNFIMRYFPTILTMIVRLRILLAGVYDKIFSDYSNYDSTVVKNFAKFYNEIFSDYFCRFPRDCLFESGSQFTLR